MRGERWDGCVELSEEGGMGSMSGRDLLGPTPGVRLRSVGLWPQLWCLGDP